MTHNKKRKSVADSKILICGVAYKADSDDYRESPALKLITLYEELEAKVIAYDPYIDSVKIDNKIWEVKKELTKKEIKDCDLIIISTNHSNVDYQMLADNAQLIFDSRNVMKDIKNKKNIEVL